MPKKSKMKFILMVFISFAISSASSQNETSIFADRVILPKTTLSSISNPVKGTLIYDTLQNKFVFYNGTNWNPVGGIFERDDTTIRQCDGVDVDDFIFGRSTLPQDLSAPDRFFFFDQSTGAFRGGQASDTTWNFQFRGDDSFAYGFNPMASGAQSIAIGNRSVSEGRNSVSMGNSTVASGRASMAVGTSSKAEGESSVAIGLVSIAKGVGSIAMGRESYASGESGSTALGLFAKATGDFGATALGWHTHAAGKGVISIGMFNDQIVEDGTDTASTNPILILGNGNTPLDRSNAMVVLKNGNTGFGLNNPTSHIEQVFDSTPENAHVKLIEKGDDGARIILENDQNENSWTIFGRPFSSAASSRINIYYDDISGAGTETGNKFQIFGNGDATLAGTLTENSDIRLKTNITPIRNSLSTIGQINGYTYNWKSDDTNTKKQVGVIAQEVREVIPEIVKENDEGILSVSYTSLVPVLIEGMKEQQEIINSQESRIDHLEDIIKKLQEKMEKL